MIVYRLMNRKELNLYISGNIENIGNDFSKGRISNNHCYMPNQKYVHMFKRLKDREFIEFERDFEYLVTFDIPMVVLMASKSE